MEASSEDEETGEKDEEEKRRIEGLVREEATYAVYHDERVLQVVMESSDCKRRSLRRKVTYCRPRSLV